MADAAAGAAAAGAAAAGAGGEREWVAPFAVDVRLTLSVQGRGRGDPTFRADEAGAIWRTSLTPDGPATLRVTSRGQAQDPQAQDPQAQDPQAQGTRVISRAWGPGATWLLDALPGCLGLHA